ncbi:MAG: bifunctional phosphopantothenoylcysteine decarboxylase/phosphopantothenate--cysteine ligase CoaBC [Clostridia bacterium]
MRLVLGVGAGIAAYKACELASRLAQDGYEVFACLTREATKFVTPLTFEALTHHPVSIAVSDEPLGPVSHVSLAHTADLMVVAPATADLIARMAEGRADDMLTAVYLGMRAPVLVAPAMEAEMWSHPAVVRQAERLRQDGVAFVGPEEGRLASGLSGRGRMSEPARILDRVEWLATPKTLAGRRVLVTAGPTREFFDPVRCVTNPSSGAMGTAIARAARNRGAEVTLVHGPITVPVPEAVAAHAVTTALEMEEAVFRLAADQDVIVASAAVSDWRPKVLRAEKVKKDDPGMNWDMVRNPDILARLGRERQRVGQILVGFAAETDDVVAHGRDKLARKRVDLLVANRVGFQQGFGASEVDGVLLSRGGSAEPLQGDKPAIAQALLDAVERLLTA